LLNIVVIAQMDVGAFGKKTFITLVLDGMQSRLCVTHNTLALHASILVIRAFLASTCYPQLGGHGLHIAHMLWGGLLMLIALVLLLAFIGRYLQSSAALLGGIGFGTFIDELGKFISSNNNYFFHPAIPLIYIVFVLLFPHPRRWMDGDTDQPSMP
jgi:hypothetical protein